MIDLRRLWADIASVAEDDGQEPIPTEMIPAEGAARVVGKARFRAIHGDRPAIAMTRDEVTAWDMLCRHRFSRASLAGEGELSAFLSLGVEPELEARWRGDAMAALLDSYPEGFETLLSLIVEYGDAPMLDRLLDVLDDSVGQAAIPGDTVRADCEKTLNALDAAGFGDAETRNRLLETAKRCNYYSRFGVSSKA